MRKIESEIITENNYEILKYVRIVIQKKVWKNILVVSIQFYEIYQIKSIIISVYSF